MRRAFPLVFSIFALSANSLALDPIARLEAVEAVRWSPAYTCTQVIGFSQTRQWYLDGGAFEELVDDAGWQFLDHSGTATVELANPRFDGWDAIHSPCAANSDSPDRIILSISDKDYIGTPRIWVDEIIEPVVETLKDRYPYAEVILLQPVIGGPDHALCQGSREPIKASFNHPYIDRAIEHVARLDAMVEVGMSPELTRCSGYVDNTGHLTESAMVSMGQIIGEYYAEREE